VIALDLLIPGILLNWTCFLVSRFTYVLFKTMMSLHGVLHHLVQLCSVEAHSQHTAQFFPPITLVIKDG